MAFAKMLRAPILSWAVVLAVTSNSFAAMAVHDFLPVDWKAAVNSYQSDLGHPLEDLRRLKGYPKAARVAPSGDQGFARDLQTINAASSLLRPNIRRAGSPVLLPMDARRLVREIQSFGEFTNREKTDAYFAPLRSVAFYPGPYGYRAYFRLDKASSVVVAGSSIFYRLASSMEVPQLESCETIVTAARSNGQLAAAEADGGFFEYIYAYAKRIGLVDAKYFSEREAVIPCLFAGALVEVSILCDAKADTECRAQQVARAVIAKLAFVGGSPRPADKPATNDPIRHLDRLIDSLDRDAARVGPFKLPAYGMPGDLLAGSGVDGRSGSRDFGVYGEILFPTDLDAAAQTVVYRADQTCVGDIGMDQGTTCVRDGTQIAKAPIGQWKDDFCEYRSGNRLFTCPAGGGHAGQDVWGDWAGQPGVHRLRAVTDGIAFRRFSIQPALTISDVNGTNIDYIYRHMRPSELTRHGIPPSRPTVVSRGCVLGFVDRFDQVSDTATDLVDNGIYYEATAPHLHFEIRVPTASGFQLVSPYWTLVEAHRFRKTRADSMRLTNQPCGTPGHHDPARSLMPAGPLTGIVHDRRPGAMRPKSTSPRRTMRP